MKEKIRTRRLLDGGSDYSCLVEVTGLEPAASCSQSRRPTNWATPRNKIVNLNIKKARFCFARPLAVPDIFSGADTHPRLCRPLRFVLLASSHTVSARNLTQSRRPVSLGDTSIFFVFKDNIILAKLKLFTRPLMYYMINYQVCQHKQPI